MNEERSPPLLCRYILARFQYEEVGLGPVQPTAAPVGQTDGAAVWHKGDEVLAETIPVNPVALVRPVDGFAGTHGGLDLRNVHLDLHFSVGGRNKRGPIRGSGLSATAIDLPVKGLEIGDRRDVPIEEDAVAACIHRQRHDPLEGVTVDAFR